MPNTLSILHLMGMAILLAAGSACAAANQADYQRLATEMENHLHRDVIRAWFPRCIDQENGGFHADFARDWSKLPSSGKFIVFQARQTWIASQVAMHRPELRDEFLAYARHGLKYLNDVMWDREHGGFFWGLDDQGKTSPRFGTEKHLYGEAFGIYAASAAYEATRDPAALDLAMRAFHWLDKHAHDAQNGGYFEALTREGKVIRPTGPLTPQSPTFSGFIYGHKSMNAHIHILEALAALYHVSKDPLVKERLHEVLLIVRDRIAVPPGCLHLWLTEDWRPVPDHDSFGHDIETGFLLLEAAEVLGQGEDPQTLKMARMLVDHALDWGWDETNGGFYERGFAFARAYDTRKIWWTQVEGLNSLLLMHEHFGHQTDRYWNAFLKQWDFLRNHQIDSEYPGLFEETDADGQPHRIQKGHIWKAGYHDGRTFISVSKRLRKLAS